MKFRVEFPGGPERGGDPSPAASVSVDVPPLFRGEPAVVKVDGRPVTVVLLREGEGELVLSIDGRRYAVQALHVAAAGGTGAGGVEVRLLHLGFPVTVKVASEIDLLQAEVSTATRRGAFTVTSPLPGVVRRVMTSAGAEVEEDAPLFTLEAMKMENEVRAARRGRVLEVLVTPGQVVNTGEALARIGAL